MPLSNTFESTNSNSHPLIRLSLIAPFIAALDDQGLSPSKPLRRLGLTFEMTESPEVFVHSEVFYGLMNELAIVANDPYLGLHVAEQMGLEDWPVLTESLASSGTVGEFLTRFVQNVPKHYTSAEHALLVGAERSQYRFKRVRKPANSAAQLDGFAAALYLRVFEAAASTTWKPEDVVLRTAYPEAIPPSYRKATIKTHTDAVFAIEFSTDILFENIIFDSTKIDPLPVSETRPTLVSAIRAVTNPLLTQEGDLSQAIADALGISVDLMEKNLASEGTTLSREIKTLKCDVASEQLLSTNTPLAAIGASIGYSEPANFTRFFKSQFAMTPNHYRKTNRANSGSRKS